MDDLNDFRQRCIDFMESQPTPSGAPTFEESCAFHAAASEAGVGAGVPYPTEFGGAGLTNAHDKVWREVKEIYPMMESEFVISHGMCLPMMNDHGTDEQKRQFMPDLISGKTLWCQMFSEPGAGSDVASLQTKAELDGDEWIINGQKVWTTLAHKSQFGLCVARNDADQVKHAGLSMFILDMQAPGVEIRPINQINGESHFNEVFFTDLAIPKDWLLGELNTGWKLATAMLMYERVAIGAGGGGGINRPMYDQLHNYATASGAIENPVVRDQMMQVYSMETTKALIAMRTRAEMKAGNTPGPGGSLGKLYGSVIAWRMREIALQIAGMSSVAWTDDDPHGGSAQSLTLRSFASGIAGGTDEIQRNIIGDRVLGLPREPAVDKGVPFRDLKVGTQA
ncbi:MAG: alkylation response protein AidB-like acyl-CoA dehydrogenase [Ilumatobacter sp.]|jgi:alkylation response protein AidB-like acyl-CoA dehydrogenase